MVPGEPLGSVAYKQAADVLRKQKCPVQAALPAGDPDVAGKSLEVFGPAALCVSMLYPPTMGRSPEELLRVLESLRTTTLHDFVGTPAGWSPGQDVVILPEVSDEEAQRRLRGGTFEAVAPYLRLAPDPGKVSPRKDAAAIRTGKAGPALAGPEPAGLDERELGPKLAISDELADDAKVLLQASSENSGASARASVVRFAGDLTAASPRD